jgi:1-acyl-sn-glycerol-3-phosphate acyltransferase
MGFRLKIEREQFVEKNKSYVFVANHASLLDPWVMIVMSKNPIVFIGKKELVKVPIFGFFYKKVVIMVDRSSEKSRKRVYEMAKKKLKNGVSIGIFPEGLVPEEEVLLAPFKNGVFRVKQKQFISTSFLEMKDRKKIKELVYNTIYQELKKDKKYMADTLAQKNKV